MTAPPAGRISRASARSSVDFPQPFGPMIVVISPSRISTERSLTTEAVPYESVTLSERRLCETMSPTSVY
jgi:hypothetical protein